MRVHLLWCQNCIFAPLKCTCTTHIGKLCTHLFWLKRNIFHIKRKSLVDKKIYHSRNSIVTWWHIHVEVYTNSKINVQIKLHINKFSNQICSTITHHWLITYPCIKPSLSPSSGALRRFWPADIFSLMRFLMIDISSLYTALSYVRCFSASMSESTSGTSDMSESLSSLLEST